MRPSSLLSRCHCTGSLSGKMRLIWVSLNLNPRSGYRKAPFHQYKVCFTGCNPLPYQKKLQVTSRTSLLILLRAYFNVPPNLNNSPIVLQPFIVTYVLWISIHFTSTGDDPHHLCVTGWIRTNISSFATGVYPLTYSNVCHTFHFAVAAR